MAIYGFLFFIFSAFFVIKIFWYVWVCFDLWRNTHQNPEKEKRGISLMPGVEAFLFLGALLFNWANDKGYSAMTLLKFGLGGLAGSYFLMIPSSFLGKLVWGSKKKPEV